MKGLPEPDSSDSSTGNYEEDDSYKQSILISADLDDESLSTAKLKEIPKMVEVRKSKSEVETKCTQSSTTLSLFLT